MQQLFHCANSIGAVKQTFKHNNGHTHRGQQWVHMQPLLKDTVVLTGWLRIEPATFRLQVQISNHPATAAGPPPPSTHALGIVLFKKCIITLNLQTYFYILSHISFSFLNLYKCYSILYLIFKLQCINITQQALLIIYILVITSMQQSFTMSFTSLSSCSVM